MLQLTHLICIIRSTRYLDDKPVSIDLHRASPTTGPTLTRVLIADAPAQDEAGGPPSRSPIKWRWGLEAQKTRFATATVSHRPNPNPI